MPLQIIDFSYKVLISESIWEKSMFDGSVRKQTNKQTNKKGLLDCV